MNFKWFGPVALLAALWIGDQIRINRPGHKYRLTVEMETPEGRKSGSSVMAVHPDRSYSRGGHTRADFPGTDKHFASVNLVTRRRASELVLEEEPLPVLLDEIVEVADGRDHHRSLSVLADREVMGQAVALAGRLVPI